MAKSTTRQFEARLKRVRRSRPRKSGYAFVLYVTGTTPRSTRAIVNLQQLCEKHLPGRYDLEVVDIYQQPELAKEVDLVASPTLIKKLPLPIRRVIGDLSDTEKVLVAIDIKNPVPGNKP